MALFLRYRRSLRRPAGATVLIAAATVALAIVGLPAQAGQVAAAAAGPTGGPGWRSVASPPLPPAGDAGSIAALAATGPASAWAVGADEYTPGSGYPTLSPVASRWEGGRWVSTPVADPDASEGFASVADGGAGDTWTVGVKSDDPQVDPYRPMIRHWDDGAWRTTPFPGDSETTNDLQFNQVAAAGGKAWIAALDGINGGIASWDGTSWTLQQISSAYELWGITAISATDAWTVGYSSNGTTLALHWNGTTWQDESPPNQIVNLQDVAAAGPDNVWAAGFYYDAEGTGPYLAADHWNGTSWTEYSIPDLPGMGDYVFPLSLTVDRSGQPWIAAYSNRADRTAYYHWSGSAWQIGYGVAQPGVIESYSNALATLPGSGAILSAGTSTPFAQLSRPYAELNPVPSASSGTTVSGSANRAGQTTAPALPALRFGAPLNAVRVPGPHGAIPGSKARAATPAPSAAGTRPAGAGTEAAAQSTAATSAWSAAALPGMPPQDSLNNVAATTGGAAWAVGEQYQGLIAPGNPLVLRRNGGHWTRVPLPAVRWQGSLSGVAAASPADAWAIGTDVNGHPHILHGRGGTWRDVPFPGSSTAGVTLAAIAAAPGTTPWVAENGPDGPALLHWTGSQWASQAAPPGDTSLNTLTVHSATDVWAAGSIPGPDASYLYLGAVSHWDGSAWTTLSTAGTTRWDVASLVAAGPDDVWISGGVYSFPPSFGEESTPLLAHWNGTAWTQSSLPVTLGFLPSLAAAPDGQPTWASVEPYLFASGVTEPYGGPLFLRYDGSAWTLRLGPATSPEPQHPETHLATVPGTTQTLAVGTAPYLFGTQKPFIETSNG